MHIKLHLVPIILSLLFVIVNAGSRFVFTLDASASDSNPECFYELLDARATQNRLLFRYELVQGDNFDAVNAFIQTPTGRIAEKWDYSKTGHIALQVRESGLYRFCFVHAGISSQLSVLYAFEFLLAGSRTFTVYPSRAITKGTEYDVSASLTVATSKMQESIGLMSFSFAGVSPSIVDPKTRIYLSLSVKTANISKLELISLPSATLPAEVIWMYLEGAPKDSTYTQHCESGGIVVFDITDIAVDTIKKQKPTLTLAIFSYDVGFAELYSMSQVAADHWPLVTFEGLTIVENHSYITLDVGTTLWIEMMQFRHRVWDLKGKIGVIVQHERVSHYAAQSANTRLIYVGVIINLVLIGMGIAQVYYIQQWLNYY
ncbi:hypothetical protein THRCLA_07836 [Thraustotheca clavata]|uniref:GOLD domain-containing protein n=1 Tax=Thraustotheca clavata TaxID=74557 RepID=A0A1V9ZBW2_9STRA|nr:hypothetical protein THRCLA_07836 [Thraustotheca clavata]